MNRGYKACNGQKHVPKTGETAIFEEQIMAGRVKASAAAEIKLEELGYKFARERNVATPAVTDAQKPLLAEVSECWSETLSPPGGPPPPPPDQNCQDSQGLIKPRIQYACRCCSCRRTFSARWE